MRACACTRVHLRLRLRVCMCVCVLVCLCVCVCLQACLNLNPHLHERLPSPDAWCCMQGIASAPLWDAETGDICGMLSPSDFIHTLRALRSNISGGGSTLSEAEMDRHSIRALREAAAAEGRVPKRVVFVRPTDSLQAVVEVLFHNGCYMAPVLSCEAAGG